MGNIAESKLSYEIMDDAAQAFLKSKIMDNIHKYFYLIAFAGYMREAAVAAREAVEAKELKISKPFVAYVEENAWMRQLIETGKGNLQWERDIPPAALSNLENLAKTDFKANLGQIIHDIYQTAHVMFSDMPQGDHKKRAKYRFASRSSTTSTRLLTLCSVTCLRETTRREPSTGSPPDHPRHLPDCSRYVQ